MKITVWDKNKFGEASNINIKNIDSIVIEKYLKKIGESSIKQLTLPKANELFMLVIDDFNKGILSSDNLSSFGFEIFHGVAKRYPKSDLFQTSLSASEISFNLRTKAAYGNISKSLEEVNKFYEKNK